MRVIRLALLLAAVAPDASEAQRRSRGDSTPVGVIEHVWKPVRDGADVVAIKVRTTVRDLPASARDRVKLFRLAWDIAGSAFGSRQVLYERFFASDPLTRARALISMHAKEPVVQRVRDFLAEDTP